MGRQALASIAIASPPARLDMRNGNHLVNPLGGEGKERPQSMGGHCTNRIRRRVDICEDNLCIIERATSLNDGIRQRGKRVVPEKGAAGLRERNRKKLHAPIFRVDMLPCPLVLTQQDKRSNRVFGWAEGRHWPRSLPKIAPAEVSNYSLPQPRQCC